MWNEAVIAGITHGGIEKPVDHQGAGVLVHLVFDRLAADRHLDDDIDLTRRIGPDRDSVNAHGWLRGALMALQSGLGQQVLDSKSWTGPLKLNWSRRRRPCRATSVRTSPRSAPPCARRARGRTRSRDRCRRAPRSPCF